MDILPAFPSKMLHGIDQQSNDFVCKCASRYSAVGDISRSKALAQSQNKISLHFKSKESLHCTRPSQLADDGLNEPSRSSGLDVSSANNSAASVTETSIVDKPVKKIAKRKYKKKKGKSSQKSIDDSVVRVIEVANENCHVAETGSEESTVNSYGEDIAPSYWFPKKEIGNANDCNVSPKCNKICSLPNTSSDFYLGTAGTLGFSISNEENCRRVVERGCSYLEESVSDDPKIDDSSNARYTSKVDEKVVLFPTSEVVESVSYLDPKVKCLNEMPYCDGKLSSKFSSSKDSNLDRGQTLFDAFGTEHGKICISGIGSSEIIHRGNGLSTDMKEIISEQREVFSMAYKSEDNSCEGRMSGRAQESGNSVHVDRIKSSSHCSCISDAHAVTEATEVDHGKKISQSSNDAVCMPGRANKPSQNGKENSHASWQKSKKSIRDARNRGSKQSNPVHVRTGVETQEPTTLVKHNTCSTDPLLPSPVMSSFVHHPFTQKVKEVISIEKGIYVTHPHVLVESPQWVAQQRVHGGISQYASQSMQEDTMRNKAWGKAKEKSNQLPKPENINRFRRGSSASKGNLYKLQNKANLSQKEPLEVSMKPCVCKRTNDDHFDYAPFKKNDQFDYLPSDTICSSCMQLNVSQKMMSSSPSDQAPFREVKTHTWMKIPKTEHMQVGATNTSLRNREERPVCLEIELAYEESFRQDFASKVSIQKWIPVGRKDSWTVKSNGVDENNLKNKPLSTELHQEGYQNPARGLAPSLDHSTKSLSSSIKDQKTNKTPTVLRIEVEKPQFDELSGSERNHKEQSRKECAASDCKPKNIPLLYIGSQMALQALNEAYRLQMASECVQLATGYPLAEFERLLHSASPVIVSASVLQNCEECSRNQLALNNSLCKHQIPNSPLSTVWKWYEKPGSYGLEVKAQDSEIFKGLDADGISFHAHFVPFLSAVQLFSHLPDPKCQMTEKTASEVPDKGETEQDLSLSETGTSILCPQTVENNTSSAEKSTVSEPVNLEENLLSSSDFFGSRGNDSSNVSSALSSWDDIKLIFEFFEHEQPQQRKPLYEKIMDLIKIGNSNHQAFGDPSKLESMTLHDLHPASWYSVAWYPIYRIPEGNFRASFLTYHSLGHLVQRCIPSYSIDAADVFSIVSPVLGLQSYNAQGECWFYPKKPADCSCEVLMRFDASDILKERLRTLEETASLFARGCVYKDNVIVANRQPDYEFFISRKQ